MGYRLEKEYSIHYYEIDYKKRCLITSLMNYFQDLAIMQSEMLGVGIDYLAENKLAWVLYRWDIKIDRHPLYGDTVKVKTYPHSFAKFYAYRKFEVMDKSGNMIASAYTVWLLVNTGAKRPIKMDDETSSS
jgi:medium-chain acyl-[acyl-carrier-protein] hydrolase